MNTIKFSLGRNTYDNQPEQCVAQNFDAFVDQITSTGSTRKGQNYICAPLSEGAHPDSAKYPETAYWRTRNLACPRRFLCLDIDGFSAPEVFQSFRQLVEQFKALVYTTASHTDSAPRGRAIVELDREVDYSEGISLGNALQRMIESKLGADNITLDASVYRAIQPVYTPLTDAKIFRYQGQVLAVDATLSAWPEPHSDSVEQIVGAPSIAANCMSPMMQALTGQPETPVEVEKVEAALAQVSADCPYPTWLNILFALRSTGWQCAETLGRNWSKTAPHRFQEAAFDKVWRSARESGGVTIGTLYHYAKTANHQNTFQQSSESGTASALGRGSTIQSVSLTAGRMSIPTEPPPQRDYVLGRVLVAGTVGVVAGVGAVAKTTAVMQFAVHGAIGTDLADLEIPQFASALFLAEESPAERDRRFGAICSHLSPSQRAEVEKYVYCEALAGHDLRLTHLRDGNAHETPQVQRIIQTALAHQKNCQRRVGLIVIDHARLVMAGDPIASDHVTSLLRCLNRIATDTGAAVLLLAHSPKSTYGKDGEADPSEIFGSGAFVDHTRVAIVLHTMRQKEAKGFGLSEKERKDHVCMTVVKANYGQTGGVWWFKKVVIPNWHAVKLEPVFLYPKAQAITQSVLDRKIVDIVNANRGAITSRGLRDRYSGKNNDLDASERNVRVAVQRLIASGALVSRPPTSVERKNFRLSANIRAVLDLPPDRG